MEPWCFLLPYGGGGDNHRSGNRKSFCGGYSEQTKLLSLFGWFSINLLARAVSNASTYNQQQSFCYLNPIIVTLLQQNFKPSSFSNLSNLKSTTKVPTKWKLLSLTNCVTLKPTKAEQNLYIKVSFTLKRENSKILLIGSAN